MFTLDNYVDALLNTVKKEKDKEKRKQIIEAWFAMLKRHHRNLEGRKILGVIKNKINQLEEKAQVSVSDEKEKKILEKYFQEKGILVEWNVNPKLIGGAKIIWNNILLDNTVNGQLDKLREKFRK